MYTIKDLYDLDHTLAADYLRGFTLPLGGAWGHQEHDPRSGAEADPEQYAEVAPQVWGAPHRHGGAHGVYLGAPCIIGAGTEVRHCAFVRGSAAGGGELRGGATRWS